MRTARIIIAAVILFTAVNAAGDDGMRLLLDSRIIAETVNAHLAVGTVTKHPANPLFGEDKPWEARFDNMYPNVMRDPATGTWRCWYNLFIRDKAMEATTPLTRDPGTYMATLERQTPPRRLNGVAYAESDDGITWTKPSLGIVEFDGSTANNLVRGDEAHGAGVFRDTNESDPSRRFKMFYQHNANDGSRYMAVSFSPDGLHWNQTSPARMIDAAGDTHNNAFFDASRGLYVGITRLWRESDGGRIRVAGLTMSPDFVRWARAEEVLAGSSPDKQVYAMPVMPYRGLYLGFPAIFDTNSDKVHVELAWSPDIFEWRRIDEGTPFIPNGEGAGACDWGCVYPSALPVVLDDEVRIYYGGNDGTHYDWRAGYLCLATLPPDRFAGWTADDPAKPATVRTTVVDWGPGELCLTADVSPGGSIRVLLSGRDGIPVAASKPVTTTVTAAPVQWDDPARAVEALTDKAALELTIDRATVYAAGVR